MHGDEGVLARYILEMMVCAGGGVSQNDCSEKKQYTSGVNEVSERKWEYNMMT